MKRCPYCQSTSGYYTRYTATGRGRKVYHFDGSPHKDSPPDWEGIGVREFQSKRCCECHRILPSKGGI